MVTPLRHGGRSSVGRAPDCGSGCRGFKPRRSPHVTLDFFLRGPASGPRGGLSEGARRVDEGLGGSLRRGARFHWEVRARPFAENTRHRLPIAEEELRDTAKSEVDHRHALTRTARGVGSDRHARQKTEPHAVIHRASALARAVGVALAPAHAAVRRACMTRRALLVRFARVAHHALTCHRAIAPRGEGRERMRLEARPPAAAAAARPRVARRVDGRAGGALSGSPGRRSPRSGRRRRRCHSRRQPWSSRRSARTSLPRSSRPLRCAAARTAALHGSCVSRSPRAGPPGYFAPLKRIGRKFRPSEIFSVVLFTVVKK